MTMPAHYGTEHRQSCSRIARKLAERRKVCGLSPADLRIVVAVVTHFRVRGQTVHPSTIAGFLARTDRGDWPRRFHALRDAGWLAAQALPTKHGARVEYAPTPMAEALCYGARAP